MKKFVGLLLLTPFIFACSKTYTVKKEDAMNTINALKEKYKTIDNVELDLIVSKTINGEKCQFAYDTKDKLFYQYYKGADTVEKKWQYFENGLLITLNELNSGETHTKYKYKTTETLQGDKYFQAEFKKVIDAHIAQLDLILAKEKSKEEYLTHGDDLIVNIEYEKCHNIIAIEGNRFISSSYKKTDESGKIIDSSEYAFSYGKFITSVNPNEFIEI